MKNKKTKKTTILFFALAGMGMAFFNQAFALVSNISIDPDLDVARFDSYRVTSEISDSPISASVEISAMNWDDPNGSWNYYADGTPDSQAVTKTMAYDAGTGKWVSQNVYPDDIYPEIFFAPSNITWNNVPSSINLRRNNYQLLHFNNPFTMTGGMTFFVEVNAEPVSTVNSADLSVYLVSKNKSVDFFNSDWRSNSEDVELIGSIGKEAVFHHTHVAGKSSHHLIALTANEDGTMGTNDLDLSGDFWVILYSNSPNANRGWNFKYHNSSICNNSGNWYRADQFGWQTATQAGCPDAHVHIARRGANSDGVKAVVTANYSGGESLLGAQEFYFEPLPNLPPVATNFTAPVAGGNYGDNFNVVWNASSDPNGDPLTYTIYLLDAQGAQIEPALVSGQSATSFVLDISENDNGEYGLKGRVCDDSEACSLFYLDSNFFISKASPIYSLSEISIVSYNQTNQGTAKAGDEIQISFISSNEDLENLQVEMYSGGYPVENSVNVSNQGTAWSVWYVVSEDDQASTVSFVIKADNLDFQYSETTDGSYVSVYVEQQSQDVEESDNDLQASISSWKAFLTKNNNGVNCPVKLTLKIKGKYFDKNAEVKIGNTKASSIDRKSSKKITAKFCYEDLLKVKTGPKRKIKVINPNAKEGKANKKIDILEVNKILGDQDFSMNSDQGIRNIQKALIQLKYLDSQYETGFYGPITTEAVKRFQKDSGIEQIGIVGPLTKAKLAEKVSRY